jgi:hypothetical protein
MKLFLFFIAIGLLGTSCERSETEENIPEGESVVTSERKLPEKKISVTDLGKLISSCSYVMAYNFNDNNGNSANTVHYIVGEDGYYKTKAGLTNGIRLSKKQVNELTMIVADSATYSGPAGMCFIPHIAFVYFDGSDNIVGQSNVCFLCIGVKSRPGIKNEHLSTEGVLKLHAFCKGLGLQIIDGTSKLSY